MKSNTTRHAGNDERPGNATLPTGAAHARHAARESDVSGVVLDVMRGSLHDGPGCRTTLFLKGCPLRCLWCHNPESQHRDPVLLYTAERCTRCGACVPACPSGVHTVTPDAHTLDRSRCTSCGLCAAACPQRALEIRGRTMRVAQVMAEVERDADFYRATGGGLTLSGGEPLLQADFSFAVLQAAQARGIHTALETSGWAPASLFPRLLPLVDLVLFDCKGTISSLHEAQTGVPNEPILRNLETLVRSGARVLLRCPLVPGLNDSDAHLAGIAALSKAYPALAGIELMPYHHMGNEKARRAGLTPRLDQPDADAATQTRWRSQLRELGCHNLLPR